MWAVQVRGAAARRRAEKARRDAMHEDLGGDSYFMPLPKIEQAVEIDNPVEIENLLSGESETVADDARRLLEETTDLDVTGGIRDLSFTVASPAPPPSAPRAPLPADLSAFAAQKQNTTPLRPAAQVPKPAPVAAAKAPPQAAAAPAGNDGAASSGEDVRIPVRELVLAWFEARGYRAAPPLSEARPIELVLHHRKDLDRSYAFVVERETVKHSRAAELLARAQAAGLERVLIAAEAGAESGLSVRMRRQGVRIFDEAAIRAELGKIDIRIAAKIIAVARGRARSRRPMPTTLASRPQTPEQKPRPLFSAKF